MATAKERYMALSSRREPFLRRARDYAALTLPGLQPPLGHNSTVSLPEPYQALVAKLVVNLASKLLVAFMPPGQAAFRLGVPSKVLLQNKMREIDPDTSAGLELATKMITDETERRLWRHQTNLSSQLLIVTGNCLEHILPDNRLRTFRLDQYVVQRDGAGTILEIVLEEKLAPQALPKVAQELVDLRQVEDPNADVCLYTHCLREDNGSYTVYQEIDGRTVPGSKGVVKDGVPLPFQPLRWSIVPGEDYGRGKVEEHGGDVRSFEALSKDMLDGAAMAARHVWLVRPNATGTNLKARIAKANNGDVIIGNIEDVNMLQFQNTVGMQLIQAEKASLAEQLSMSFLASNGVIRDSERTTAEEVRMVSEELEANLGGTYSLLGNDMLRWRLDRLMVQMRDRDQLPAWPDGMVEPHILVGLEALSREKDVGRVRAAAEMAQVLDPNGEYVKTGDLLKRGFIGLGLPGDVRTEEEAQKLRQERAQLQALTSGVGTAIGAAGRAVSEGA